ncbi:MAG TPA: GNAT family N-acetyltransferase [Actinomycetota bacterium]|nr:GNAT family N-acetyltransferase [Actinomycetota bacterium]
MTFEVRELGMEFFEDIVRVYNAAFGEEHQADVVDAIRPLFETGRTLGAFDGPDMVGLVTSNGFDLSVQGGDIPTAAVTGVATIPTHRRRGVMRLLLEPQLTDFHERGLPLAALWASEAPIYQRFGYGHGALAGSFNIDRQYTAILRPAEPRGRARLVDKATALKAFPSIYDRVRPTRAGMPARDEMWWEFVMRDLPSEREGASPNFYVLYETPDGADGYVVYRIREGGSEEAFLHGHTLIVEELVAATADAYAALWTYCFGVDLVGKVTGWKRPVDEPLLHLLAEPRALRLSVRDGMWLRIVDVAAALAGRRYGFEGTVTMEITDPDCPWNEGRYRLEGGPEGAGCSKTDAQPDLAMDASTLASVYLGAVRLPVLAAAGRVEERTPGSVERADRMFATTAAPWCPHIF